MLQRLLAPVIGILLASCSAPQHIPTAEKAVDWLKRYRKEVLVGTVVVIAGVAFVVAVVGSGGAAMVLVPAVLLVSNELPGTSYAVGVKP